MIFTGAPAWFVLICVILAAGYSFTLYYKERKTEISAIWRTVLGIFRFLAIFFIAFLLLSPFIKTIGRTQEKPVVIIAQDNSGSVVLNPDSGFYRTEYLEQLDQLARDLGSEFNVRLFTFGESVNALPTGQSLGDAVDYNQKLTNISDLYTTLSTLYSNRNLGALILATDGVYNSGYNPVYQTAQTGFPTFALALGDTSQRKDLILTHVAYNRIVYLDSKFPIQLTIHAHDCNGSRTVLRVTENGQSIFSREINISQSDYTETINVMINAREKGLSRYRITLDRIEGELSFENNVKDVFVEVLDANNKILILYHSPHPDIAALRHGIESNMNYEVDDFKASSFTGYLEAYDMVVLHQLPASDNQAAALLAQIKEKEIPALYIIGTQTDLIKLNQEETGLKIISPRKLFEESLPILNPTFGLFTLTDETKRALNSFPPLTVPAGDYQQGSLTNTLLSQRIGTVQTSRPLIVLSQNMQNRSGVITGEGLWRWRMMDYMASGNQDAFNELFNKIFQFLSLKEQKKNLRIYHKGNTPEYERLQFDAEVYNRNYELINEPELEIIISDEPGKQYPFTFSKSLNAYRLDAGKFPPGNYSYQAKTRVGEEVYTASGQFAVTSVDLESVNLVADHNLLHSMVAQGGGKVYYPGQLDLIAQDIRDNSDIKPVIYTSKKITELINFPWLLLAILSLLSLEWFVRKRSGSY